MVQMDELSDVFFSSKFYRTTEDTIISSPSARVWEMSTDVPNKLLTAPVGFPGSSVHASEGFRGEFNK